MYLAKQRNMHMYDASIWNMDGFHLPTQQAFVSYQQPVQSYNSSQQQNLSMVVSRQRGPFVPPRHPTCWYRWVDSGENQSAAELPCTELSKAVVSLLVDRWQVILQSFFCISHSMSSWPAGGMRVCTSIKVTGTRDGTGEEVYCHLACHTDTWDVSLIFYPSSLLYNLPFVVLSYCKISRRRILVNC